MLDKNRPEIQTLWQMQSVTPDVEWRMSVSVSGRVAAYPGCWRPCCWSTRCSLPGELTWTSADLCCWEWWAVRRLSSSDAYFPQYSQQYCVFLVWVLCDINMFLCVCLCLNINLEVERFWIQSDAVVCVLAGLGLTTTHAELERRLGFGGVWKTTGWALTVALLAQMVRTNHRWSPHFTSLTYSMYPGMNWS